jgi:hypothetical protein
VSVAGEQRTCHTGPAGTRMLGICRDGQQRCELVPGGTAWGDCLDEIRPRTEICSNRLDDDCNGLVDDGAMCVCAPNTTRSCYTGPQSEVGVGVCRAGNQVCNPDGLGWSACAGEVAPSTELCGDGVDNDCDGTADGGCPTVVNVPVDLNGDCVTARCPAEAPYPVGCSIIMAGGDPRGCVASSPTNPVVYFQEGHLCGAGHVAGLLMCSSEPGAGLNASNCVINKAISYYPTSRSGCPATNG